MTTPVIEAHGLTKRYAGQAVVDSIDLTVEAGEVVGLLGPNGAGKTTTILMLLGLTEPSAGSVRILGKDPLREPLAVKSAVGYLPDSVGFYDNLTARENLNYIARLAGLRDVAAARIDEAFGRVRLADVADRPVKTFSHGMRQRLGLAEVLMRNCQVAILDEPTSGLDPQSTHELLDLVRSLSGEGMTFVLSSHLLDVVQTVCNRIALFNAGKIGFVGTVDELAARIAGGTYAMNVEADGIDISAALGALPGVRAIERHDDGTWQLEATADLREQVANLVIASGGRLRGLSADRVRLDELYSRYFKETRNAA